MQNLDSSVAIVIPYYKKQLSSAEKVSLSHYRRYLSHYPTFCICAENFVATPPFPSERFADHYFENVRSYSQLLLTPAFYERFSRFTYILIYQLDALVLSDQLKTWCAKNYDYVGAPWWRSVTGFLTSPDGQFRVAGNGGFSLRKVASHLAVLHNLSQIAAHKRASLNQARLAFIQKLIAGQTRRRWLTAAEDYPFNEDGFWSFEAKKYVPSFKIPTFKEALAFAIETQPQKSLEMLEGSLPFGIHAWEKYDKEFLVKRLQMPAV